MRLEHGHVITLTHLPEGDMPDYSLVECGCGKVVAFDWSDDANEWIKQHRIDNFPFVRYNLTERGRYDVGRTYASIPNG